MSVLALERLSTKAWSSKTFKHVQNIKHVNIPIGIDWGYWAAHGYTNI